MRLKKIQEAEVQLCESPRGLHKMFSTKIVSLFVFLSLATFLSAIYLVHQIYNFRVSFSETEKLNKEEENLSFQTNLLLSEVEYFRNQLTIRKIATNSLKMRYPLAKEQVSIYLEGSDL